MIPPIDSKSCLLPSMLEEEKFAKKKEDFLSGSSLWPPEALMKELPPSTPNTQLFNFDEVKADQIKSLLKEPRTYHPSNNCCSIKFSIQDFLLYFDKRIGEKGHYCVKYKLVGGAVLSTLTEEYFKKQASKMAPHVDMDLFSFSHIHKKLNDIDIRIHLPDNPTIQDLKMALDIYLDFLFDHILEIARPERQSLKKRIFKKLYPHYDRQTKECFYITCLKGLLGIDLEIIFIAKINQEFRFLKESITVLLNDVVFKESDVIYPTSNHPNPYAVCYDVLTHALSLPTHLIIPPKDGLIYFSRMARYGERALARYEEERICQELTQFVKKPGANLHPLIDQLLTNHHSHPLSSFGFLVNLSQFLISASSVSSEQIKSLWRGSSSKLEDLKGYPAILFHKVLSSPFPFRAILQELSLLAFFLLHIKPEHLTQWGIKVEITSNKDKTFLLLTLNESYSEAYIFLPLPEKDIITADLIERFFRQDWSGILLSPFDRELLKHEFLIPIYQQLQTVLSQEDLPCISQAGCLLDLLKSKLPSFNPWLHLNLMFAFASTYREKAISHLNQAFKPENIFIESQKDAALFEIAFIVDLLAAASEDKQFLVLDLFFQLDPLPTESDTLFILKYFCKKAPPFERIIQFMQKTFKSRCLSAKKCLELLIGLTLAAKDKKRLAEMHLLASKSLFYQALKELPKDNEIPKRWVEFLPLLFQAPWQGTEVDIFYHLIQSKWISSQDSTFEEMTLDFAKQLLQDGRLEDLLNLDCCLQKLKIQTNVLLEPLEKAQPQSEELKFSSLKTMSKDELLSVLNKRIKSGAILPVTFLMNYVLSCQSFDIKPVFLLKELYTLIKKTANRNPLTLPDVQALNKFLACLKKLSLAKEEVQLALDLMNILFQHKTSFDQVQTNFDLLALENVSFIDTLEEIEKPRYYELRDLIKSKLEKIKSHSPLRLEEIVQQIMSGKFRWCIEKFDDLAALSDLQDLLPLHSPTRMTLNTCFWKKLLQLLQLDEKEEKFKTANLAFWKATKEFKIGKSVPKQTESNTLAIIALLLTKSPRLIKENYERFVTLDLWFGPSHESWHHLLEGSFQQLASLLSTEELLKLYQQHPSLFEASLLEKEPAIARKLLAPDENLFLEACHWRIEDPQFWKDFIGVAMQSKSRLIRQQGWKGFNRFLKQADKEALPLLMPSLPSLLKTFALSYGSEIIEIFLNELLIEQISQDSHLLFDFLTCLLQFLEAEPLAEINASLEQTLVNLCNQLFTFKDIQQNKPIEYINLLSLLLSFFYKQDSKEYHYQIYLIIQFLLKECPKAFQQENCIHALNYFCKMMTKSKDVKIEESAKLFDPIFTLPETESSLFLSNIKIVQFLTAFYTLLPAANSVELMCKWVLKIVEKQKKSIQKVNLESLLSHVFISHLSPLNAEMGFKYLDEILHISTISSMISRPTLLSLFSQLSKFIGNLRLRDKEEERSQYQLFLLFGRASLMIKAIGSSDAKTVLAGGINLLIERQVEIKGDYLAQVISDLLEEVKGAQKETGIENVELPIPFLSELILEVMFTNTRFLQYKTLEPLVPLIAKVFTFSSSKLIPSALLKSFILFSAQCPCDIQVECKKIAAKFISVRGSFKEEEKCLYYFLLGQSEQVNFKEHSSFILKNFFLKAIELLLQYPTPDCFEEALKLSETVIPRLKPNQKDLQDIYVRFLNLMKLNDSHLNKYTLPYELMANVLFPEKEGKIGLLSSVDDERTLLIAFLFDYVSNAVNNLHSIISDLMLKKKNDYSELNIIMGSISSLFTCFLQSPYTSEEYGKFINSIEFIISPLSDLDKTDKFLKDYIIESIKDLVDKKPSCELTKEQEKQLEALRTICQQSSWLTNVQVIHKKPIIHH